MKKNPRPAFGMLFAPCCAKPPAFKLVLGAILLEQRGQSSEETGSIGDHAVATETGQTTGEEADTNEGGTNLEPPVQSSETAADVTNEAPTETTEEAANAEGSTTPSLKTQEGELQPREGAGCSESEGAGLCGDARRLKDESSKQGGEAELDLPLVATDITLVACRAGEKVTEVLTFEMGIVRNLAAETCSTNLIADNDTNSRPKHQILCQLKLR